MKKINISEASAIIGGGSCTQCFTEYIREGNICNAVTTCRGKHGRLISKTTERVPSTNCGTNGGGRP